MFVDLKPAEQLIAQGKTVIKVPQPTYHRWRQQYGGMQARSVSRIEPRAALHRRP